jgi:hypothetical protein
MSYGKYLVRQEMALKLKVQAQQGSRNLDAEMGMANKAVTVFEFKECVVGHNLTDDGDQPLNFAMPHTVELLDPKIGDEIGTYINDMHRFDSGNSLTASDSSSSEAANPSPTLSALPSSS